MGKIVKSTDKNGQTQYPVTIDDAVVCTDGTTKKTLKQKLATYQPKEEGKSLSTNDFTDTLKAKLESLHEPLVVRTYTGLYYGANSYNAGYFSPICVKPKDTTKSVGEYYIKYKVSTTCAGYPSYSNYSIIELWLNRTGTVNCYRIWNWRVGSYLHYYANVASPSTQAAFDSFGSLIGIGIVLGNNYNSASYKRTCVFEVLKVSDDLDWSIEDSCDSLLQYQKTTWYTSVTGTGATVSNGTYNAVDVGLQESGDSNTYDRYYTSYNSIKVSNYFRLMANTLSAFDKDGNIFALGQHTTTQDTTARIASLVDKGEWASGTAYIIGDEIHYASNDIYYRCIKAHTASSSILPTNTTYWQTYRAYNKNGIDWKRGMLYGGVSYAKGTTVTSMTLYHAISGMDFRHTFNCVASNATANTLGIELGKSVYIRGYIKDGLFYIAPTLVTYSGNQYVMCWTQNPVDESIVIDGVSYPICYWLIGYAYYSSSYTTRGYQVNLIDNNTMWWFKDSKLVEYNECDAQLDALNAAVATAQTTANNAGAAALAAGREAVAAQTAASEAQSTANSKQDVISDLETIRQGAAKGATALQTHQDISGLATKTQLTNGSVTKVGTSTLGSTTKPVYLKSGVPTICNEMVDLASAQTISGAKTFGGGASFGKAWHNVATDTNQAPDDVVTFTQLQRLSCYAGLNVYSAAGDYFYCADRMADVTMYCNYKNTVAAAGNYGKTELANLFNNGTSSDVNFVTANFETTPLVIEITTSRTNGFCASDVATLQFYQRTGTRYGYVNSYKIEVLTKNLTTNQNDWMTIVDRDEVQDSFNKVSFPVWRNDGVHGYSSSIKTYGYIWGIRLTVRKTTNSSTYPNYFNLNAIKLVDQRPSFKASAGVGALDMRGGKLYGDVTFEYGKLNGDVDGVATQAIKDGEGNNIANTYATKATVEGLGSVVGLSPRDYGAKADGTTDDTEALRACIKATQTLGGKILIGRDEKYKVTGTLNYYDGDYNEVSLDIVGILPNKRGQYSVTGYGGIIVANGVSLFMNAQISGSISNVSIVGYRDESTYIFNNCSLSGFVMSYCNVTNFGAFMIDTSMSYVSHIKDNTFLSVFYFAKKGGKDVEMIDSFISGNYINGGSEPVDNYCFGFMSYNGSEIYSNFVDYYRTIYYPAASSSATVGHINSHDNQYQVFRYFYYVGGSSVTMTLNSNNDAINWTDPNKLAKLQTYTPIKYTGKDGNNYDLPPYVFGNVGSTSIINITNITLERNVGNVLFFRGDLNTYDYIKRRFHVANSSGYLANGKVAYAQGGAGCYNNGTYKHIKFDTNFAFPVTTLPSLALGWSNYFIGTKVIFNNQLYTATLVGTAVVWVSEDEVNGLFARVTTIEAQIGNAISLIDAL